MSLAFLMALMALLLLGLFCLTAVTTAFRRLQRRGSKKQLDSSGKLFFYRSLSTLFSAKREYEDLYFAAIFAQNVTRFCYAILSLFLIQRFHFIQWNIDPATQSLTLNINWILSILILAGLFLILFIVGDFLARVIGNHYPEHSIKACAPVVSCFLVLLFPLIFVLLKISHAFLRTVHFDPLHEPIHEARQELMAIIEEFNLNTSLDPHDRKLIESVMEFKDRIAREIMVPRVDIFSLPHTTSIEEAANLLYNEGYSRTPVYKDTLDNIIGVLMYKDVLAKYMEQSRSGDKSILQKPIESLVKNVLYVPETKKISHLLQEFRKQQVHLAIIVDEYGGTEGIVTIEDILEEIVGDIADEYDEEEALFIPLTEGGWLIDARMSILDIEEQLGIEIPQDGDYDTIGGYIFHEAGMIPTKGFIIHNPSFELEVVRSSDRCVEKLRIKSLTPPHQEESERLF